MESSACFVGIIVKFAACMKRGKNNTLRGNPLFMHFNRNATAAVPYGAGTVRLQRYPDLATVSGQVLIHRIIYNLIDQVIQPLGAYASDIHTGPLADCL